MRYFFMDYSLGFEPYDRGSRQNVRCTPVLFNSSAGYPRTASSFAVVHDPAWPLPHCLIKRSPHNSVITGSAISSSC